MMVTRNGFVGLFAQSAPPESKAARWLHRLRHVVNPLCWLAALAYRCRAAAACPKRYDIDLLEQLGPNTLDTGDLLLLSPRGSG